jgi:hypothetical protein
MARFLVIGVVAGALSLGGCGLPDKDGCLTAGDCLAGRACVGGRCVAGSDGDLAVGDAGPADMLGMGDGASGCDATSCPTGTCEAGQCLPGRWSARMPMPTARANLAAAFGSDGKLYALGGSGAVVEAYDPAGDSWSSAPPMPHARSEFAAATAADGRLYAVGGPYTSVSDPGVSHLVDAFSPSTGMWAAAPSLAVGRTGGGAVVGADGNIYAVGGFDQGSFAPTDTVETLAGAQWTTLGAHLLTARSDHATAVLADGRIFAFGGISGVSGPKLDSIESLPSGGSAFVAGHVMTEARSLFAAATVNGRIYVIGGNVYGVATPSVLGLVEAYDPATQSWTRVASLPTPRFALAAAAGSDGKIYAVGGHDGNSAVPALEVLTP